MEKQHERCPRNGWSHPAQYDDKKRLPHVFIVIEQLKPLYERLSSHTLLDRCLQGLTQNQNEALNRVLCKCPKTKFCGMNKVTLAVTETVAHFNTGAASKAVLMKTSGVSPDVNMLTALRKCDKIRIMKATKTVINESLSYT